MTFPTFDLAIDWNNDGDFSDPLETIDPTEILDRGTTISIEYGRDQARALAPISAGTRTPLELDNLDRKYSPDNTSSPLYPNVQSGRELRLRATHASVTYGLLRGYIDDFDEKTDLEERSVELTVIDVIGRLRDTRISTALYTGIRTGQAIGLLLDAYEWPSDRRDLDVGASVLPYWCVQDEDAFTALQNLLDSEGGPALATVDINGNFVYRDRHHRLLRSASITSQATLRASGLEPCYSGAVRRHGAKEVINSVSFDVPVRLPAGELSAVWSMAGTTALEDGEIAVFSAASTAPFIAAIVPEPDVDYDLLSGTISVSLSQDAGQSATLLVTAVGGPAIITRLQLRAYAIETIATVVVKAEHPDSITKYGRRTWPSDRAPVWAGVHDARAIASIILGQRAERLPTVQLTLQGGISARLTQQLARNLSDRVRVINTTDSIDAEYWIEQIAHTITNLDVATTFGCEQVPAKITDEFVLNSATRGVLGTNRLGAAGMDDPDTVFILDAGLIETELLGT